MSPELSLLYQALSTALGIEVDTSDPLRDKQKLYAARAAANDPSLSCLQIRSRPDTSKLWIVRGPEKVEKNGKA